jgi:Mlc titration factor MtfA (ptsG expression regulator)
MRNKFGKIYKMIKKFYLVTPVTGFNRANTKEDAADGDINILQ